MHQNLDAENSTSDTESNRAINSPGSSPTRSESSPSDSSSTAPIASPNTLFGEFESMYSSENATSFPMALDSSMEIDYTSVLSTLMLEDGSAVDQVNRHSPLPAAIPSSKTSNAPTQEASLPSSRIEYPDPCVPGPMSTSASMFKGKERDYSKFLFSIGVMRCSSSQNIEVISFFAAYLPSMVSPILHAPSWTLFGKPWLLLRAMQTCGAAMYSSNDAEAETFMVNSFTTLHEAVTWEFVCNLFLSLVSRLEHSSSTLFSHGPAMFWSKMI